MIFHTCMSAQTTATTTTTANPHYPWGGITT